MGSASAMRTIVASAPAKVILLGGKAVNWGFPALAAAVGLRTRCTVEVHEPPGYTMRFGEHEESGDAGSLEAFKERLQALVDARAFDEICRLAREDFFAPVRHVLSHIAERTGGCRLRVSWSSEIPIGAGLGSGAAAAASLAVAGFAAAGVPLEPSDIAWTAWQADVVAHGGMGTGLDSSASSLGGIVRYALAEGSARVPAGCPLPLVIGDTLQRASTAESNCSSRAMLEEHPARFHLMQEIGMLVLQAERAIREGDLGTLGHLMNLNHLIKEKLGLSVPATEKLIEAALAGGALGAKISGKGLGGIILALAEPGKEASVARAIESAGGRAMVPEVAVAGASVECDRET